MRRRIGNRRARELIELAAALGWSWSLTRSGHVRFDKPGRRPVFTATTPSDWRAPRNAAATLRRLDRTAAP